MADPAATVPAIIQQLAGFEDRPALIEPGRSVSFRDLAEAVSSARSTLRQNTPPCAVVALLADFSKEGIAGLLACAAEGRIAVPWVLQTDQPPDPRKLSEGQVAWIWDLRNGGAAKTDLLHCPPQPAPDQPPQGQPNPHFQKLLASGHAGLILFSSGSSGHPKAMIHDFTQLLDHYRDRRPKTLRLLAFLLFDHIGGLHTLFGALASGATLVVPSQRTPEAVAEAMERHQVAVLPASPSFLGLLLLNGELRPERFQALRIISYGTEPMPESLLQRLRQTLPRTRFIQTFGTSETGIAHTVSQSSSSLALRIDDPSTEFKIVDGELWLRSQTQIMGYLHPDHDSRFTPEGWFRTGDRVEMTDQGYLRILGRESDLINVGGEKVFPAEVESTVLELPDVLDCIALGEPNALTGQSVSLQVVPAPQANPTTLKQTIRRHCQQHLARFKQPTRIRLVPHLTLTPRFKRAR